MLRRWAVLVCSFVAFAADRPASEPYVWRNVEIVGGGFVPGIVMHPGKKDLMYARTDIGGAYRWNPETKRWIPLTDWISRADWNLQGIESIGIDPSDVNRLYLAAGTYIQSWAGNGAIFRSSDQGETFEITRLPFKLGANEDGRHAGERLAVDPVNSNILYLGTRTAGLWRSTDFAATWSKVTSFPVKGSTAGVGVIFVLFDADNAIYAGVSAVGVSPQDTGLYRSVDGGATWQAVDGQPSGMLPNHGVLAADGVLYLTYGDQPGPNNMTRGSVWKFNTIDGSWTDVTPVAPGRITFGYGAVAADASNPGTVMVATMDRWSIGDDIFRSVDGGAHWIGISSKSQRDDSVSPFLKFGGRAASFGWWIGDIEIDPFNPDHVLYVTGATIWGADDATNTDAVHWTPRAAGLEETAVLGLISPPDGAHLLSALGDIGGFRHDDLTVSPPAGMMTNPVFSSTTGLDYAGASSNVIVRLGYNSKSQGAWSNDGGTTWTPFPAAPKGAAANPGSIAASADGGVFVWTPSGAAAAFSTDLGSTWTPCQNIRTGWAPIADRVNPAKFYAFDPQGGQVWVSNDGAATFQDAYFGLPRASGTLVSTPGIEGDLWLVSNNGLFHSSDSGKTFVRTAIVQQAYYMGFGKPATDGGFPAMYLMGQIAGIQAVFRSDDAGAAWVRINDDEHQYGAAQYITGDPRIYGRVYVGSNGRGILYADPAPAAILNQRPRLSGIQEFR